MGRVQSSSSLVARQSGLGSGVVLTGDGFIVTNHHVVQGARRISVRIPVEAEPGKEGQSIVKQHGRRVEARLVGFDTETDLAVLKVDGKALPTLSLADSHTLGPGQLVLAFGSPLGLQGSVTMGVVSAVGRQLTPESNVVYIQTDAPINPGNSGGPLVNAAGKVVGINTSIRTVSGGNIGLGFAVPSNIVRHVVDQLRKHGRVRRGIIGVNAQTMTPVLASALRLDRDSGVVLADVYPGGPADRAGLRVGDIVLSLGGKPMENGRQFSVNVYLRAPGEKISFFEGL
jgi:serine protease Do